MSAQPVEPLTDDAPRSPVTEVVAQTADATLVEVRRSALVSFLVGGPAAAMGIAYLGRAAGGGGLLDWVLCLLMAVIAVVFLRGMLDARTPLLVVDEMGIRVRLGSTWRGLPWEAVDRVSVTPRRGLLRDGRVVVGLHHLHRAIEGLDGRARRHARLNQRLYGGTLAVPLGLTTRVVGGPLRERVEELSSGRAEVVTLLGEPGPVVRAETVPSAGVALEESAEGVRVGAAEQPMAPAAPPVDGLSILGSAASVRVSREPPMTAPAATGDSRVRAIARLAEPVPELVISDFAPEPAYDPVIGPELAAARTRVGLSVDELAERTRIRPHVIESIEVDDFAPCGGDFYARGHIRTLARVLGKDPAPMLAHFEQRYAGAPVNARRVFEAELATGLTGSIRSTSGGPNWALLAAVVVSVVLVWSAVRLFAGDPAETFEIPPPVLNGSGGVDNVYGEPRSVQPPAAVPTTVTAVDAGATVEVRDGNGDLVFEGDLVIGEVRRLQVEPPITVWTDNAAAVSVRLGGTDVGFLGTTADPATRVFQRPDGE